MLRWVRHMRDEKQIQQRAERRDFRSWHPHFVVVAIFIAGIAAIGLKLVFRSELSGPPATIKAENGPAKLQKEATTGVDVPARDASTLSKPPGPPSRALVNSTEQPLDLPQAEETLGEPLSASAPIEPEKMRTDLQSEAENGPAKLQKEATTGVDVPARDATTLSKPPGPPSRALVNSTEQPLDLPQAEETLGEPLSASAPIEPEKMRTDLQLDGASAPNVTLPQASVMGVLRPTAAATAPAPKIAVRVAKTAKPAAAILSGGHDQPRQIVKKAKAKHARPLDTKAVSTAPGFTTTESMGAISPYYY